jgi:hypothetical protein
MPINHSAPKPIQVAAAVVGNALELYDFIIFGFLTVVIARLFFPADSQYASLLLTTATFVLAFSCDRRVESCSGFMLITKAESPLCFNYRPDDGGNRHDRLRADLCSHWCGSTFDHCAGAVAPGVSDRW